MWHLNESCTSIHTYVTQSSMSHTYKHTSTHWNVKQCNFCNVKKCCWFKRQQSSCFRWPTIAYLLFTALLLRRSFICWISLLFCMLLKFEIVLKKVQWSQEDSAWTCVCARARKGIIGTSHTLTLKVRLTLAALQPAPLINICCFWMSDARRMNKWLAFT